MAEPARGQARDLETAAAQVHDALIECPMLDDIGNGTDVIVTLRSLYNEVVRDAG